MKVVYNPSGYGIHVTNSHIEWLRARGYTQSVPLMPRHHPLLVMLIEAHPNLFYSINEVLGETYAIQQVTTGDDTCEQVIEPDDIGWITVDYAEHSKAWEAARSAHKRVNELEKQAAISQLEKEIALKQEKLARLRK